MEASERIRMEEAAFRLCLGADKAVYETVLNLEIANLMLPQSTPEEKIAFVFGLIFSEMARSQRKSNVQKGAIL